MTSNILEAKDPSDVKDYRIDWTLVLTAEGSTGIASSVWSLSNPEGLDLVDGSPSTGSPPTGYIDGMKTITWVGGGTAGIVYELTNTIVTTGGMPRTHQRTIVIPCEQR
jgi:hypothetical protein